jgi:hypothetical protein
MKKLSQLAGFLLVAVGCVFLVAPRTAYSASGYDPDGQEVVHELTTNTCAPSDGSCAGTCTYQDYTLYKCRLGTGNCTTSKVPLGSSYAGECNQSGSWVVNAILRFGQCVFNIGYSCGGTCYCDTSAH